MMAITTKSSNSVKPNRRDRNMISETPRNEYVNEERESVESEYASLVIPNANLQSLKLSVFFVMSMNFPINFLNSGQSTGR